MPTSVKIFLCVCIFGSPILRAQDAFEIQVYDGSRNKSQQMGIEFHFNHVAVGHDQVQGQTVIGSDQLSHETLELSYGVTPNWELGFYFQLVSQNLLNQSNKTQVSGNKIRSKYFFTELANEFQFGFNLELAELPDWVDKDRWSAELRPIFSWTTDELSIAVNPILSFGLMGDNEPDFEPCFKLGFTKLEWVKHFVPGIEYFSALGKLNSISSWSQQANSLYAVVDADEALGYEIQFGLGHGLTSTSDLWVAKMILGLKWN